MSTSLELRTPDLGTSLDLLATPGRNEEGNGKEKVEIMKNTEVGVIFCLFLCFKRHERTYVQPSVYEEGTAKIEIKRINTVNLIVS